MAKIRSVNDLIKGYQSKSKTLERMRAESAAITERGMTMVAGLAGGASSGAVRGLGYAMIPNTEIETDLVLGAAAATAGVMGFGGKQSEALTGYGIGMMAPAISRMVEKAVK